MVMVDRVERVWHGLCTPMVHVRWWLSVKEWEAFVIIIGSEGEQCGLVIETDGGRLWVMSVVMGWGWSSKLVGGEGAGCGWSWSWDMGLGWCHGAIIVIE
jgi:hypothetical protein